VSTCTQRLLLISEHPPPQPTIPGAQTPGDGDSATKVTWLWRRATSQRLFTKTYSCDIHIVARHLWRSPNFANRRGSLTDAAKPGGQHAHEVVTWTYRGGHGRRKRSGPRHELRLPPKGQHCAWWAEPWRTWKQRLGSTNPRSHGCYPTDLTQDGAVRALAEQLRDDWGAIDILAQRWGPFHGQLAWRLSPSGMLHSTNVRAHIC
jgi:hypothetical protein